MDKTDETALVKYAQSLEAEIERLRTALRQIASIQTGSMYGPDEAYYEATRVAEDALGANEQSAVNNER